MLKLPDVYMKVCYLHGNEGRLSYIEMGAFNLKAIDSELHVSVRKYCFTLMSESEFNLGTNLSGLKDL